VERIAVDTAPDHDLQALARAGDAPGYLAGLVLALRSGEPAPEYQAILDDAAGRAEAVRTARPYRALDRGAGWSAPVASVLEGRALLLLDALLAQKEEG
jgi:hypothetical protein